MMWDTCGILGNPEPLKAPFYQCLQGLLETSILFDVGYLWDTWDMEPLKASFYQCWQGLSETSVVIESTIIEVVSMPVITDWIMVGITLVYVIATIAICIFNGRSAEATKEQVEESKKQFEESKRLELMPFLQVEIPTETETPGFVIELPCTESDEVENLYAIVRIKNVGNGSATNIIYSFDPSGEKATANDYLPINAIMMGDVYTFQFTLEVDGNVADGTVGCFTWQYDDLLGRSYEQRVNLVVENEELIRCENDVPTYLGVGTYQTEKE